MSRPDPVRVVLPPYVCALDMDLRRLRERIERRIEARRWLRERGITQVKGVRQVLP